MNNVERDFIELTKRAINMEYEEDSRFDSTDWENVFELASKAGFCALLYEVAKNQKSLPEELRKKWDKVKFLLFVRQASIFFVTADLAKAMEEAGIDYAIFKGPVLANNYPIPEHRVSADTDFLVNEKDKVLAAKMIEERGYVINELKSKDKVLVYGHPENGHVIELHTSVFENYVGGKIDLLKGAGFDDPDHRITVVIKGKALRTLGISQHLLYQMFHIIKHFVLEGAGIKFIADVTLFVNANKGRIDKDYFWSWMNKCGYGEFGRNFLTICINYFGMDPEIMEGYTATATKQAMDEMLVDFIYKGDAEHLRRRPWQIADSMEHYLVGSGNDNSEKEKQSVLEFCFPRAGMLDSRYEYAKRNHFLLPVAWVHRGLKRVHWILFIRKKERLETDERVRTRVDLLKSVGIED